MKGEIVGTVNATCDRFDYATIKKNGYSDESEKFIWEITDFYRIHESSDFGDFFDSPTFITKYMNEEVEWILRLRPSGISSQSAYTCFSIRCPTEMDVRAKVQFYILKNTGESEFLKTSCQRLFGKNRNPSGYGYRAEIEFADIRNPEKGLVDINGKLRIACKIKFDYNNSIRSYNKSKKRRLEEDVALHLEKDYEALLNDNKFGDVSLIAEGKVVRVYKGILVKRSAVFAAMFENEMIENQTNTVEIDDINHDVLLELLRFIYAGKVNDIDTLVGELAIAADKYALNDLKFMCEVTMSENLSADNVVECLRIADTLLMEKLKEDAVEFIVKKASEVTESPEFNFLSLDLKCKVSEGLRKKVKR